jgi:hypothetical protein
MNKKEQLIKLVKLHIKQNGNLFMPYGPDMNEAYLIDEDSFKGPVRIPEWIVPASFSSEVYKAFNEKLNSKDMKLEDLDPSDKLAKELFSGILTDIDANTFV